MHVANLEPDILLGERSGRVRYNVLKALRRTTNLETLLELLLLLVDYPKPEVNLVGFFEIRLHSHDL